MENILGPFSSTIRMVTCCNEKSRSCRDDWFFTINKLFSKIAKPSIQQKMYLLFVLSAQSYLHLLVITDDTTEVACRQQSKPDRKVVYETKMRFPISRYSQSDHYLQSLQSLDLSKWMIGNEKERVFYYMLTKILLLHKKNQDLLSDAYKTQNVSFSFT